ncbi:hypothetical protein CCHR01_07892 [Colletotrichum chrysophilum]|uniref:Uncharacterized protein n=1 Tax=Colletotrichum chrysophilum TaxID=1836956 RepID=A0AAD9AKM0_9PEZI|nr:hypothetical protein CCHR01_07892 [Colletotrichum chrysophilum]
MRSSYPTIPSLQSSNSSTFGLREFLPLCAGRDNDLHWTTLPHTTGRKGPGSPVTFCSRPPYAQHEHPAQPQPSDVVPAPRTSAPKRLPLQQCDHPTQDDSQRITSPGTTQWLRHGRKAASYVYRRRQ